MRILAWACVLLLAACATPEPPSPRGAAGLPLASAPIPEPGAQYRFDVQPPLGPVLEPVVLRAPMSIARSRVEMLAASCWLDDELAAEIMLVDTRGDIVAAGAEGEMMRIGFAPVGPLETAVRLSGPAVADQARAQRMTAALSRSIDSARPTC